MFKRFRTHEIDGQTCRECGKELTQADLKGGDYIPDYGYLCPRCVSENQGRKKLAGLLVFALIAILMFSALAQNQGF